MSDHAWILENLAAYLTDGLEPADHERLEQHLNECVPCAAVLVNLRTLDTKLTGVFVEERPSAVMEDRLIQTLRTRPAETWRLSMPMWLACAAAALVLIGFTGAVASQILSHGRSGYPEAMLKATGSFMADYSVHQEESRKNADELAQASRESVLTYLEQKESRRPPTLDSDWSGAKTANRTNEDIPNSTTYTGPIKEKSDPIQSKPSAGELPPAPAVPPSTETNVPRGNVPPPGGMMGMGGGMMMNPYQGYLSSQGYNSGSPLIATATPTSPYSNVLRPQGNFQPGTVLDEPSANKAPKSNSGAGKDEQGPSDFKGSLAKDKDVFKQPEKPPPSQQPPGPRKIVIRSGEVEYEVQSFDAAVATIARLMKPIKGGFVATVNSDKLANGKVRGSVVVRVPPENLDELILELRTNLGKSGELKNQRISSQDIGKEYTDLESRLKAARAMEERLLQIIKNGKGEIKDLLAAEKQLGEWRSRIEEIEGTLRFYANQVALSTLTITLYEKEMEAAYGVIEREQVQMGIEADDVDQAFQAALKAVREAKGRITRSELKQPSQGQFSAVLHFEVAPDAAGLLRDRFKQLGTVARLDITRQEENEGGSGKPSDGKSKRRDTRFHVHFYNLTDVPPRETVYLSLACVDVETAMKTLLARVDKAAGRVLSSNLNSTRSEPTQSDLQFQVKTTLADAVLEDIKSAGEVMGLQVRELSSGGTGVLPVVETTRKKRGFQVKLWALEAATARETDDVQLACSDVAASYRGVLEAVAKVKGRVRNAQLNEQDRRNVTATLDVEVRRADEAVLRAALTTAGEVYTRTVSRAADADNVVDSKVFWKIKFINQSAIPPRETFVFGVEVADVDQTAAMLSALVGERQGRTIEANVSRERSGRVTGKLIYDVPMAKVHELIEQLKSAGTVRVQQSVKHPEIPDSPLAIARLDVTLSNKDLIVPTDEGLGTSVRGGLSDSFTLLAWSLRFLIFGLCVLLPWALVVWAIYRLVVRMRRRASPAG